MNGKFGNFFLKMLYVFSILLLIFGGVFICCLAFDSESYATLFGLIPVIVLLGIFLFSIKSILTGIDTFTYEKSFNDYVVVLKDEYELLLRNGVDKYKVYDNYHGRLYIMTGDNKLLFKIDGNKVYSPYGEKIGKIGVFGLIFFVNVKGIVSFWGYRNLSLTFGKYYIKSRDLVYDDDTETICSSFDLNNVYVKVRDRKNIYYFDVNNKEIYLEAIFLVIMANKIEYTIRH